MLKYLFGLFICSFSFSQDIQIEYEIFFSTESPIIKTGYLIPYISEQKSNYYEVFKENVFRDKNDDQNITETISVGNKNIIKRNFTDYKKQEINSIESSIFTDSLFMINEKLPNFNWNIEYKDTITIGGYTCKKATTKFRGRSYVAWYAPKLSMPYGPWKFYGLPGLIFEVYDSTRRYEWSLKSITNKKINEDKLNLNKADYTLSLRKFIDYKERMFETKQKQLLQNIKTRTKRGIYVNNAEIKNLRTGKELIYEWEEEEILKD